MKDVIVETLIDSFKLLPFLFVTFLIIELFEHKLNNKSKDLVSKSGKYGPLLGSLFGIIPQCGFSVCATNFYTTRIISLGTLIAVYLATSDEMIPILIAERAPLKLLIIILILKFIIGILIGYIIDLIYRKEKKVNYHICKDEHCDCDEKFLKAVCKHTINIFIFILICTLIINLVMHYWGSNFLENILLKDNILSLFITSLIGLIPNCGGSVILTELFLNNAISFAALMSGLLSASGIAILVLFKTNKNKKENFAILGLTYIIGVIMGIIIHIVMKLM